MRNGKFDPTEDKTPSRSEEAAALRELLDALGGAEKELRPIADNLERIAEDRYRGVLERLIKVATQIGEIGHNTRRALWNRLHRRRG